MDVSTKESKSKCQVTETLLKKKKEIGKKLCLIAWELKKNTDLEWIKRKNNN